MVQKKPPIDGATTQERAETYADHVIRTTADALGCSPGDTSDLAFTRSDLKSLLVVAWIDGYVTRTMEQ